MKLTLPTDSGERKGVPLYSGCYTYFPAALAGVAIHSKNGNDKHNPGEPLHHARGKSMDHADCIARHSMDLADMLARRFIWTGDEQAAILAEARALSWRALAWHQEIEEMFGAPLAPAARLPLPENKPERYVIMSCEQSADEKWPLPTEADKLAKALASVAAGAQQAPGAVLSAVERESQSDHGCAQYHPERQHR